jgi:hypothetical protein
LAIFLSFISIFRQFSKLLGLELLFVENSAKIPHKFHFFRKISSGCEQNGLSPKKNTPFFIAFRAAQKARWGQMATNLCSKGRQLTSKLR